MNQVVCSVLEVLYVFCILIRYQMYDFQMLSHPVACLFTLLVFLTHKFKNFHQVQLSFLLLLPVPLVTYLRSHRQVQCHEVCDLVFLKEIKVLHLDP